jgi:hypothetical protein
MMSTRSRALPIGLAVMLLAATAAAQQPPAEEPPPEKLDPVAQEAEHLFLEGREAVKKGELGRAAGLFLRSQELHPTVGTLLNLANVEEQLGKISRAVVHYELAMKELPENDDRGPVARDGIARLAPRVPTLRIDRAAGAPLAMAIRVDGVPLAASQIGAVRSLDPGSYTVTVEMEGRAERRYTVKVLEGARMTLAVEPGKPIVVAPPAAAQQRTSRLSAAGWAFTGFGVAGLGVGAVAGIAAIAKKSDAAAACPDPARCGSPGLESAAAGRALAGVSTAAFVLGGVGVAAGVTLLVVGRSKAPKQGDAASVTAVAPWALPGGGGVGMAGKF